MNADELTRRRAASSTRATAAYTPEQQRILDGDWTPGERRILEAEAVEHGWEWTRTNAWRILDEARSILGEDLEHE